VCDHRSLGDVTIFRDLKVLVVVGGVECEREQDVLRFASWEIIGANYDDLNSNGCRLAA
jgi:hypothetical protein